MSEKWRDDLQPIVFRGGPMDGFECDTLHGRNRITQGLPPNRDIYRRTADTEAGRIVFRWTHNEADATAPTKTN